MTVGRDLTAEGSVLVLANLPDVRTDAEGTNVEFRIVVNDVPLGFANSGSCTRHYGAEGTTCPAINLHGVAHLGKPAGTNISDLRATVQYRIQTGGNMFIGTVSPRSPPAPPPPPPPHAQWIQADAYCKHKSKYDEYISMNHTWPITCAKDGATQDECVGGDEWITSGDLDSCKERWCDGANWGGMYNQSEGDAVEVAMAGDSNWTQGSNNWYWSATSLDACQRAAIALSGDDLAEIWYSNTDPAGPGDCYPSRAHCQPGDGAGPGVEADLDVGASGQKYHYTFHNVPWNAVRSDDLWCAHSNDGMYHAGSGLAQHDAAISSWGMDADHDGGYRWMTTSLAACQRAAIALSGDDLAEIWYSNTDPAGAGACYPSRARCPTGTGAAQPGGTRGQLYYIVPLNYDSPSPRSGPRQRQLTTLASATQEFVTANWSSPETATSPSSPAPTAFEALPTPMTLSFVVPLDSGGKDLGSSALVFASLSRVQAEDKNTPVELQLLVDSVVVGSWQSSSSGGGLTAGTSSFTDPSLHAVVEGLVPGTHDAEVKYRLPEGGTIRFPADAHGEQHRRLTVMSNRIEPHNETARIIGCWDPLGAALPFRIALASTNRPSRTYLGAASDGSMMSLSPTAGHNQQWVVNTSGVNAQGRATYHIRLDTSVSDSKARTYLDSSEDGTMVSSWWEPGGRQQWDIEDHGWYSLIKAVRSESEGSETRIHLGTSSDGQLVDLWTSAKARQRWVLTCDDLQPCWNALDDTTKYAGCTHIDGTDHGHAANCPVYATEAEGKAACDDICECDAINWRNTDGTVGETCFKSCGARSWEGKLSSGNDGTWNAHFRGEHCVQPCPPSPPSPPSPLPYIYNSCAELHLIAGQPTGVYGMKIAGTEVTDVYCDMDTNGGGWMLLLTQTDGITDFSGSVVPFKQSASASAPSTSTTYARDWSDTGAGLLPAANDQIMIKRNSDGDWVMMTLTDWCGTADWEQTSVSTCGGSGHPGYGAGAVTRKGGASVGTMYFNGCSHGGNCASGGGDGAGFSTHSSWANGNNNCFGGCYNGASNGGSPFYWAGVSSAPDVLTYWFRAG